MSYNLQIKYFGLLAEITSSTSEHITFNEDTVEALVAHLIKKYPAFAIHEFKVAVNQQIVENNALIFDNAEVAFLPPFAGG